MKNICRVCNTKRIFDPNRGVYKRCVECNKRYVLKHYYNNRDAALERNKKYYQDNKSYLQEYNRNRYKKIVDLHNQTEELTNKLQSISVS